MIDKYYKLPYAFFENEKYMGLTANEKLIYCVLYARYELSMRHNDFSDEDGTFVYYTIQGLMSYVGISSNKTVVNALNNLEDIGLVTRKRCTPGQPNKIYVNEPEPAQKLELKYDDDIDFMFPGLRGLITADELGELKKVIAALASGKRDSYKIGDEQKPTQMILNHIMLLATGDVVNVIYKMREHSEIKNRFMYLMNSLYDAA